LWVRITVLIGLLLTMSLSLLIGLRWAKAKSVFAFPYPGEAVSDIRFSPDGRMLAVVTTETRIYQVSDGRAISQIENGAWKCAWNSSGSSLAAAAADGQGCDVWDTTTWNVKRRLRLSLSDGETTQLHYLYATSVCFDQHDNLYMATEGVWEYPISLWQKSIPSLEHAIVWWNDDKDRARPQPIGTCARSQYDLSAASVGRDTLVAVSYDESTTNPCPVEILKIHSEPDGGRVVEREYQLRELQMTRLHLSTDGKYLVARDANRFYLFELSAHHAYKLVHSRDDPLSPTTVAGPNLKMLDLSTDGHMAAYGSDNRVTVMHIPDCRILVEIPEKSKALALSPNGRMLAMANRERKVIAFYRIPQSEQTEKLSP
jgi:WD40 repeat protein